MRNDRIDPDRTEMAASGYAEPDDPSAIRADIERTRERMGRTVEELGERLNPDRLKGRLKQNLHDATIGKAENMARMAVDRADHTRHGMMDSIRDNPIPAAMVGVGLGWLFLNSRRDTEAEFPRTSEYAGYGGYDLGYSAGTINRGVRDNRFDGRMERDYAGETGSVGRESGIRRSAMEKGEDLRDRADEMTHSAQDRVTEVAHEARDHARDVADRAQDAIETGSNRARGMASDLASGTRRRAHRVEDRFEETLHETPLAIGAAAVAIGMAVGLSAPSTRRESELMGGRRDQLVDRAKHAVSDAAERGRDVADRVVHDAESTVREEVNQSGMR